MIMRTNKITNMAILVTIGMILGYLETFINIIPVSGVKLGLSNAVLIYCVYKFSFCETFLLAALKSIINGVLFGGVMSVLYSFPSSVISVTAMYFLFKYSKNISVYGISMLGSCLFNIFQFLVAAVIFGNFWIMINLWYVLPLSLITGLMIGEIYRVLFIKDN